jgi:hypothetical protein
VELRYTREPQIFAGDVSLEEPATAPVAYTCAQALAACQRSADEGREADVRERELHARCSVESVRHRYIVVNWMSHSHWHVHSTRGAADTMRHQVPLRSLACK